MKIEEQNTEQPQKPHLNLGAVSTRTFLFKGWYNGKLIEKTIEAPDRESAIVYIATDSPE